MRSFDHFDVIYKEMSDMMRPLHSATIGPLQIVIWYWRQSIAQIVQADPTRVGRVRNDIEARKTVEDPVVSFC